MSFLGALFGNESGLRNIANTTQGTSSGQAQGYFQITTGTWNDFGGQQYAPTPLQATYAQQAAVASLIPLKRWDPSTLAAITNQGYTIYPNATLGQNVALNGDSFGNYNPDGSGNTSAIGNPAGAPYGTSTTGYGSYNDLASDSSDGSGDSLSYGSGQALGTSGDDITGYSVSGVNAPLNNASGSIGNDQGTPSLGGAFGNNTAYTGAGQPVNITDLKGLGTDVSGAGKSVQTGAQNAATGVTGTIANAINSLETYTSTAFVVVALVVLGVVFVAYGLGLFGKRTLAEAL